jgi:phosphoribosylaminoimidazolecarboxamide formyltransferase/IMP cyclohydrolase
MDKRKQIRRALISVYDKSRLEEIGKTLSGAGVEIIATGSTAKTLAGCGITVKEVSEVTGFPEIMEGRVKTLHPGIHSGILADQNNSNHMAALTELGIEPFDLVIINLYPFEETIAV